MSDILNQRELDDLLAALTSSELEDSVPVKHPIYYAVKSKVKTFWMLYDTTIITATVCSFIGATLAIVAHEKLIRK